MSASATSGLLVLFVAAGQCTIAGPTVTLTGAGSCTVTASQPGNGQFLPAPDVAQTFTIGPAPLVAFFTATPNPAACTQVVFFDASGSSQGRGWPILGVRHRHGGLRRPDCLTCLPLVWILSRDPDGHGRQRASAHRHVFSTDRHRSGKSTPGLPFREVRIPLPWAKQWPSMAPDRLTPMPRAATPSSRFSGRSPGWRLLRGHADPQRRPGPRARSRLPHRAAHGDR